MTDDKTMTVERFDPEISCGPPCVGVMEPAAAGEYVRYADYQAALQARDAEVDALKHVRDSYCEQRDQAEAECARLREDAARLDYIERTFSGMTNRERYLPVQMIWGKGCNGRTLRQACDKYMRVDALLTPQAAGGDA